MSTPRPPAESYEAFMVQYRFRPWAIELLDRAELFPGIGMLDIACGTGIVARVAASRLRHVRLWRQTSIMVNKLRSRLLA